MAFDRPIAALTAFCEASGASPAERRAVTHTFFNRAKSGHYPETVAGVCLQRFQFSEWNDDAADNRNLERGALAPDNDPVMQDCLAAFDEVAAGAFDPTGGATHYHDKSIQPPAWTVGATMCLETPKFFFYRNVK
jgi:spore germination cell wall hydrolase CwlJ-like protein